MLISCYYVVLRQLEACEIAGKSVNLSIGLRTGLETMPIKGTYQVGLLRRATLSHAEEVDLWSARDTVVMKAVSLRVPQHLPLSEQRTHLKGHSGLRGAVRQVFRTLPLHRCG